MQSIDCRSQSELHRKVIVRESIEMCFQSSCVFNRHVFSVVICFILADCQMWLPGRIAVAYKGILLPGEGRTHIYLSLIHI